MAKDISIGIASDTREYATGIQRGVITPTEDAQKALEEVGRSGDSAGTQLEQGMRTAQRGTDELKADIKALSGQVQEAGSSSRSIGTKFKASTDEASEGVKTLKENTASNLKEVAASFDGTAQGAVGGIQGLVAEFLEGFGPGGLIAGAVLAGGIGLISSAIQSGDEQTQQFRADVGALAQSWIDAGRNGRVSTQQLADGLKGLATQSDTSKASLADVEQQARTLGVPFKDLARVYAEGGDATQYAIDKTQTLINAERDRANASLGAGRIDSATASAAAIGHEKRQAALQGQLDKLKGIQRETKAAAADEAEWIKAGGPDLERKAEDLQTYADSVQSALHDAGADWESYKTKEGGLSLAAYEKGLRAKIKATEDYQTNVSTLAQMGNADALGYIESLGEDAAPLLQKFVDAPKAQQRRLIELWAQLGKSAGGSFNDALQDKIPGSINGPKVLPPDTSGYLDAVGSVHRAAQEYLNRNPLIAAITSPSRPGQRTP